jgi:hypothetical protein
VAGTAPPARTSASSARASARLRGRGMPWQIRVDSRATTGCRRRRASATSGLGSISGIRFILARRGAARAGPPARAAAS